MAIKFQALTVADTALGFTVPSGVVPNKAVISVETAAFRIRLDGSAATATVGHLVNAGDQFEVHGFEAIAAASMIRDTGTSAALSIHYFDGNNYIKTNGG